jgi:hypothetical protein
MKTYTIKATNGISLNELYKGLNEGAKFVIYGYCVSILALTFRLISPPHFIRPGERISKYRLRYNVLSLIFGWWGFPWGPIYTVDMIKINFKNGGGIDVTEEITSKMVEKYSSFNKDEIFVEGITVDFDENELTR